MTIRQIYRDDLEGRFAGHSFVETVIGSTTLVEFQDAGSNTVAQAAAVDVNDAYATVRTNMVGGPDILPRLTQAQRDALTDTPEGTPIFNVDAEMLECLQGGSWSPTNQLVSGDPTFLGSVKVGDTTNPPAGSLEVIGTDAASSRVRVVRYQGFPNAAAMVQIGHSRGTEASPEALLSGDRIGQLVMVGGNGVVGHSPGPVIRGVAAEGWSGSEKGSRLTFETVPPGETDEAVAMTVSEHGYPECPSYTVAGLPAVGNGGGLIYVSDETGGPTMAFSDGTNWRRVQDRAIVA
jgi:hypothetical protein